MARYRIVIEIDAPSSIPRSTINELAMEASDVFTTRFSNTVYLSTEKVEANKDVLKRNAPNGT